jgi:hypothetical protein
MLGVNEIRTHLLNTDLRTEIRFVGFVNAKLGSSATLLDDVTIDYLVDLPECRQRWERIVDSSLSRMSLPLTGGPDEILEDVLRTLMSDPVFELCLKQSIASTTRRPTALGNSAPVWKQLAEWVGNFAKASPGKAIGSSLLAGVLTGVGLQLAVPIANLTSSVDGLKRSNESLAAALGRRGVSGGVDSKTLVAVSQSLEKVSSEQKEIVTQLAKSRPGAMVIMEAAPVSPSNPQSNIADLSWVEKLLTDLNRQVSVTNSKLDEIKTSHLFTNTPSNTWALTKRMTEAPLPVEPPVPVSSPHSRSVVFDSQTSSVRLQLPKRRDRGVASVEMCSVEVLLQEVHKDSAVLLLKGNKPSLSTDEECISQSGVFVVAQATPHLIPGTSASLVLEKTGRTLWLFPKKPVDITFTAPDPF